MRIPLPSFLTGSRVIQKFRQPFQSIHCVGCGWRGSWGRRPRAAHRNGRNSFASKRAGGGRRAGKIASRVWEPHPYTSVWMLQVCVAANLPKKVGGVPGRGFKYKLSALVSCPRLSCFLCNKESGQRSAQGGEKPAFIYIYKYMYMKAIKFALPQTCPKRQGRGIFPLENPSPIFLEKL